MPNVALFNIAGEEIGKGSMDFILKSNYGEYIEKAKAIYEAYADKIILPTDLGYVEDGVRKECAVGAVPAHIGAVDIGSETAALYQQHIRTAKTVSGKKYYSSWSKYKKVKTK